MSLQNAIPGFNKPLMVLSSGEEILEKYIKPLLSKSTKYYKISSFFSPVVIKTIFQQLEECLKYKGNVKLVIGVHDSIKLIPILDNIKNKSTDLRFKLAVERILRDGIEECLKLSSDSQGFLNILSQLIIQNRIQVKVACVKKDYDNYLTEGKWPVDDSTFHPKVSIFMDNSHTVVMNGSINSTKKGFSQNVEEASFVGSWDTPDLVLDYTKVFNDIWNNKHKESFTMKFDKNLRKVIKSLQKNSMNITNEAPNKLNFSYTQVQHLLNNSPLFFHYSFTKVRLLPHQYLVYKLLLSRWPIVGLLADEVGLGKTIEAGATLKYLKTFFKTARTALLVPSSLRHQWQNELYNLFGLKFYIYDSSSKSLLFSPNNEKPKRIQNVKKDFFEHGIDNIIFSWHFIRSTSQGEFKLSKEDNIECVLVDEAHGARISDDQESNSTLLYRFLKHLLNFVPHKLLLTATPFQTQHFDYISLLRLLMANDDIDEMSLRLIAKINNNRRLLNQEKINAMLELLSEKPYFIRSIPDISNTEDLSELLDNFNEDAYVMNHPTTLFSLRNTRDQLRLAGYRFPNVLLESSPLLLSDKQKYIFHLAHEYIENELFSLESAIGVKGLGFVKTIYHQRIVSSIKACYDTLRKRKNNLISFIIHGSFISNYNELSEDFETIDDLETSEFKHLSQSEISIARTELDFVNELLSNIDKQLLQSETISDPKIDKALELIDFHLQRNESIIVFSRFTSTTDFLVSKISEKNKYAFGRYQGNLIQVINGNDIIDLSRQKISKMFANFKFPVMICSDAASEGLNLQSANVIINIDVPWNPARLLQRFGRIDRFGQKNNSIYLYNLFYPDTIEDRMYSRLHLRNIDFRELLGATPEITSESHIRDLLDREVFDQSTNSEFSYKNSLINIEKSSKTRIHELIIERVMHLEQVEFTESKITFADSNFSYSLDEIDENYLDLNHPIFQKLKTHIGINPVKLYELKNDSGIFFFYCVKNGSKVFPMLNLNEILDYLILSKPIALNQKSNYFIDSDLISGIEKVLNNIEFNVINHDFIQFKNNKHNFYRGLELVKTEVDIDIIFT